LQTIPEYQDRKSQSQRSSNPNKSGFKALVHARPKPKGQPGGHGVGKTNQKPARQRRRQETQTQHLKDRTARKRDRAETLQKGRKSLSSHTGHLGTHSFRKGELDSPPSRQKPRRDDQEDQEGHEPQDFKFKGLQKTLTEISKGPGTKSITQETAPQKEVSGRWSLDPELSPAHGHTMRGLRDKRQN